MNIMLFCFLIKFVFSFFWCDFKGDVPVTEERQKSRPVLHKLHYWFQMDKKHLFQIKHTLPHCFCKVTRCFSLHCCIKFSLSCLDDWRLRPLCKAFPAQTKDSFVRFELWVPIHVRKWCLVVTEMSLTRTELDDGLILEYARFIRLKTNKTLIDSKGVVWGSRGKLLLVYGQLFTLFHLSALLCHNQLTTQCKSI